MIRKILCQLVSVNNRQVLEQKACQANANAKPKTDARPVEALSFLRGIGNLLALEPRVMFDGAAVATGAEVLQDTLLQDTTVVPGVGGDPSADPGPLEVTNEMLWASERSLIPPSDRQDIVFIDTSVEDFQILLEGIDPHAEVILLDPTRDGMEQIAEILGERSDIDAVHLISHGEQGELWLGTGVLNLATMQGAYADELAIIKQALAEDADLLIYGCHFGAGEAGKEVAHVLADLTGADIGASDDLTGAATLGGDWDLEVRAGLIDSAVIIDTEAQASFGGLLDITTNLQGHWTFDANANDSSGNGNNGTLEDNASIDTTSGTNKIGSGKVSLDGNNDYVELSSHTSNFRNFSEGTIASWVKFTGSSLQVIYSISDTSTFTSRVTLGAENGELFLTVEDGPVLLDVEANLSLNDDTWHHVAVTVDSGGNKLYVDGVEVTGANLTHHIGNASTTAFFDDVNDTNDLDAMQIGLTEDSFGRWNEFGGLIDDVRVFSRALSAADIDQLYATSNPLVVDTTSDTSDGDTTSISTLIADKGADGNISLREALEAANNTIGLDTIRFNVTDPLVGGAHTIDVLSALPNITDAVIIDGTSDPDFGGTPIVELDGSSAGLVDGLRLISGSDGSTIRGLVINQFGSQGIEINNSDGNTIAGNHIGTDVTGTVDLGNGSAGIYLFSAQNNIIGGTTVADRNLVSGNQGSGILRQGSNGGNVIQGNYIGTDVTGTLDLGNAQNGIAFAGSGVDTIGGAVVGAGNVISGNNMDGISIGAGANGVIIQGNYIGINVAGTGTIANTGDGIAVNADNTQIGGTTSLARNIISGNSVEGIDLDGNSNTVQGNYVGTDVTGTLTLGNIDDGIDISGANNTIGGTSASARNIISGNSQDGIEIGTATATGNVILGNYIGTDVAGAVDLGNGSHGVRIFNGASTNILGGTAVAARNVIAGNDADGVYMHGTGTSGNVVQGNYIGLDATGTMGVGNGDDGVWVGTGATGTTIGGTTAGARNVISGNIDVGIVISGTGTSTTVVQGNYIGIDAAGTSAVANHDDGVWIGGGATNTTIGGTTAGARNIISGNLFDGVQIHDVGTSSNVVQGNYIGTDVTGLVALANGDTGISMSGGATGNTIGGTTNAHRNVISGNTAEGVHITGSGTDSNTVSANYIGTDSTGAAVLGNGVDGVRISASASSNIIGGTTAGERNIISGNADDGIQVSGTGNVIQGNYIGTDAMGTMDFGNGDEGIELTSATNTIIGGLVVGARNVIAGNTSAGIRDESSSGTIIKGNYIGVDVTGTATLANSFGIQSWTGSANGVIGGSGANEGNVIGGNTNQGIILYSSSGYTIQGNYIGTDSTGTLDLGNSQNGIYLSGGSNHLIGGTGAGEGNVIAFNDIDGIALSSTSTGNTILGNQIHSNDGLGIDLGGGTEDAAGVTANDVGDADTGANNLQNYPVISTVSTTGAQVTIDGSLNSTASTTFRIEFFASATADGSYYGEAERYLGVATVTTDGSGDATISETLSAVVAAGEYVTATATVIDDAGQVGIDDALAYGVTSEFGLSVLALSLSPVNSVPAAQNTNEDTALVFNSASSNLISITDDTGETLEMTLSVTNGTLTLSQTTGLIVTAGANGTNTMTVTGTVEDINAALDGLQYDPTADYHGSDTLALTTNDTTLLALNLDANLQGYYEFTSGDPGNDSSPGGTNDGTLNGDATVVNDVERGEVLSLDGNGDSLQIASTFGGSQNITIGGWVKLSGSSSGRAEFISIGDRVHIALDDSNGVKGSVQTSPGVWTDLHSNQFIAGTGWHQITYVFDGANDVHRLYIDGVEVASAANTNTIDYAGATTTYIGRHPSTSPGWDLEGMVDDVRIYDRVLTASEIADLVASPVSVSDSDTVSITVDPINDAPVISSDGGGTTASVNVVENTTAVTTVTSTDVDGGTAVYSVAGGLDAAKFSINSSTGELTFVTAPDYENPTDSDSDNVYVVTVQVSDGNGGADTQTISVTVTDVANTLTVTTTTDNNDSGITDGNSAHTIEWLNANMGGDTSISLREAIIAANNTTGLDTIGFNLALTDANHVYYQDDGVADSLSTIVATTLDDASIIDFDADYVGGAAQGFSWWRMQPTSLLPDITDAVIIDGSTQAGWEAGQPVIEVNGALAGTGVYYDGLTLSSSAGSTVRGLVINQFDWAGIQVKGPGGHTIVGNFIGTDVTGTMDLGNRINGIEISSADNNVIGGTTLAGRNIISGNNQAEITLGTFSTGNIVQGNYLGLDVTGTARLGNSYGLRIYGDSNQIGGTGAGEGNVIAGVRIESSGQSNVFEGNDVGTDAAGTSVLGGMTIGFNVSGSDNIIGGTAAGSGNLISGNSTAGVYLTGTSATGNVVQGNLIGTDVTGTVALGNKDGIHIRSGSSNNTIGGTAAGARNVISGNTSDGIEVRDATTSNNVIQGNYIGTDVTGTQDLGNAVAGIRLNGPNNMVGGTTAAARNVIAGNTIGITIGSTNATGNQILGNHIGTTAAGTGALGNTYGVWMTAGSANTIGGTAAGAGNVISGNTQHGVYFSGTSVTGNVVQGNFIGTNANGTAALGNGGDGIYFSSGTSTNTIGGTAAGAGNVISGNTGQGIEIHDAISSGNVIQGNLIGLDVTGTNDLGNSSHGLWIDGASTVVGGTTAGAKNVISGNDAQGIEVTSGGAGTVIQGNYIGSNESGTAAVRNDANGIRLNATTNVTIGGTTAGARNVISGNNNLATFADGIWISGGSSHVIQGNYIGTTADGLSTLGNAAGGVTMNNATNMTIGGTAAGAGNVISGNADGIYITNSTGTIIQGNDIGTDATGTLDLGNTDRGIQLFNGANNTMIGGTAPGAGNRIAENNNGGILISESGTSATGNSILGNQIYANGGLGIEVGDDGVTANDSSDADTGANNFQNFPVLSSVTTDGANVNLIGTFNSTASTTYRIEFFASATADASGHGEAERYLGFVTVTTDGGGNASFNTTLAGVVGLGEFVTATATVDLGAGSYGDTSEFAANRAAGNPIPFIDLDADDSSGAGVTNFVNTFTEDGGPVLLADSDATLTDLDSANLSSLTVTITNLQDGALEVLAANTTGTSITASYDSGTGVLTLNGSDTVANYQQVLRTVTYDNTSDNPVTTTRVIQFVANDGTYSGNVATTNLTVTAVNDAPVNTVPGAQTVAEDTALAISGVSVNDVDGNLSTVQLEVTNGILNVILSGGATISGGGNGTSILTLSGSQADINATLASLNYQGNLNFNGSDTLTVTSTDANSVTDVDTVAITVTAVDDAAVITGDVSYSGNEGDAVGGDMDATDVDGLTDGTYFTVTSQASNGTAAIDATSGVWTFTPTDPNWFGSDSFTVTVTDDQGGTTTQVVSVTLANVNDAPVANDDSFTTPEDTPISTTLATGVLANDTDVDGDTLTVNTIPLVDVANGTLVLNADGSFTYTPNTGWSGTDTFTYQITDGNGGSAQATATLTVVSVNDPPVITSHGGGTSASLAVAENSTSVAAMTATDPDGDPLTYSIVGGADAARFTIDAMTGALQFRNAPDFEKPTDVGEDNLYEVQVQVSDGQGGTDVQAFAITVTDVMEGIAPPPPPDPTPEPSPEPDPSPEPMPEPDVEGNPLTLPPSGADGAGEASLEGAYGELASRGPEEQAFDGGGRDVVDVLGLPPLLRPGAWATTSDQIRSYYANPVDITKTELPTEFLQQLNTFSDELEENLQEEVGARSMFVNMVKSTGLALSTGILAWMLRGGTLLTSLMAAAVPAWRQFDPVPILRMDKKDQEAWTRRIQEAATMEAREHQGLGQILQDGQTKPSVATEENPSSDVSTTPAATA